MAEKALISEVLAYFKVAYKRIIDNIPMRIEQHFVSAFSDMVKSQFPGHRHRGRHIHRGNFVVYGATAWHTADGVALNYQQWFAEDSYV
jgi:hypothetical protein